VPRGFRSRLDAITLLLAFGWGKPKETVAVEGNLQALTLTPAALSRLSDAELAQAIALATRLREIAEEAGGA